MSYHSQSYAPSAPPAPDPNGSGYPYPPAPTNYYGHTSYGSHGHSDFPPGTHPEVIRSFQMVDRDRSGFIDESELQLALSSGYQRFSLDTIRLLMFLFKNPRESLRIGPKEFAALWSCLGQWRDRDSKKQIGAAVELVYTRRPTSTAAPQSASTDPDPPVRRYPLRDNRQPPAIFERFDRDRSGKIDSMELRDALYSLGYAIPPSVLQVLISRYDDGSGRRVELNFDSFVESGMIVKGLTEKFKEKDPRYTGSATLTYDTFMSMIIPFLVA
ncbi:hypothetical protein RHGRI_036737 [Rhododendron griersonianum]|uniref:EF-hand domain-containing protein n=1 Tax=Rhododendron griersonianum TaxID=479676 RepID=A0AAV6HQ61_9ERIC|nr:hypothetical protein RHGRI_036737 [Rhododendron griersonianum]